MLSGNHQNYLQKNLLILSLGVGVGVTAIYAHQKLITKTTKSGCDDKVPETPMITPKNQHMSEELGSSHFLDISDSTEAS